jgi:hypothetical protein
MSSETYTENQRDALIAEIREAFDCVAREVSHQCVKLRFVRLISSVGGLIRVLGASRKARTGKEPIDAER